MKNMAMVIVVFARGGDTLPNERARTGTFPLVALSIIFAPNGSERSHLRVTGHLIEKYSIVPKCDIPHN